MKKKILALAFVLAMSFGLANAIDQRCRTMSVSCPAGYDGLGYGGWTGLVCEDSDYWFYMWYYCPESELYDGW